MPGSTTPGSGGAITVPFKLAPVPVALDSDGVSAAAAALQEYADEEQDGIDDRGLAEAAVRGYLTRMLEKQEGEERPFWTPRALAAYLSIDDRTMRTMLGNRTIPSYKVGGSRRIDPADVAAYLEAHRSNGNGNGR